MLVDLRGSVFRAALKKVPRVPPLVRAMSDTWSMVLSARHSGFAAARITHSISRERFLHGLDSVATPCLHVINDLEGWCEVQVWALIVERKHSHDSRTSACEIDQRRPHRGGYLIVASLHIAQGRSAK